MSLKINQRPRRNRQNQFIRNAFGEAKLSASNFVWPVFIIEGSGVVEPILSLPGQSRLSIDQLSRHLREAYELGISGVALFPVINSDLKDKNATEALNPNGLVPRAIKEIKKHFGDWNIICDIALDPYNSDGHDGLVREGHVLNDESVKVLGKMSLVYAEAGANWVAPSDMMDGRVGHIRSVLDENSFSNVGIISYTAKYASHFYGPFRQALDSEPGQGDKKTYQLNPENYKEALREARLDSEEGADVLMVKPALSYLDIIYRLSEDFDLPIAAYQVSGEYAMIKAAAEKSWINEVDCMLESLVSIRRAGAQLIFSYFALEAAKLLK